MRRLAFVLALLACDRASDPLAARLPVAPVAAVTATLPNIVVIYTDDMRAELLPYLPTIKASLVDSGVTFTKAFDNSPLCCPSRASLLTGVMQHTTHVDGNSAPGGGATVFSDATTIATDLHAAGYQTAYIGKYLNQYNLLPANYVPPGWDYWAAYKQPHYQGAQLVEKWSGHPAATTSYSGYTPGVLRQRVSSFLQGTTAPFLLVFTPYAPHREVQPDGFPIAAAQDVGSCAGFTFPPFSAAMNEQDVSDKPAFVQARPKLTAAQVARADTGRVTQCEALMSVDRTVHDILHILSSTGRLANTLLIFATDNGYQLGEHRLLERKGVMYDESIRTPLVVRGLGSRSGVIDTNLVQVVDLTETIRAVAGLPMGQTGRDLRATLTTGAWTTDAVLIEMTNSTTPTESFAMVRTHAFAYAEYPQGGAGGTPFTELYDLRTDPAELVNIAANSTYATTVQQLHARMVGLQLLP